MRKLLINVKPAIKALEISNSTLGGYLIGSYKSRFRGKGVEFEEYKEYTSGDDSSLIDWKASVKANKILIKEYSEERNLKVFFLLDVSNSMVFTTTRKLKAEFSSELIISLAFLMIKNSDQVGFAMFSDKIIQKSPPRGGLAQYYRLINCLINPDNYGGDFKFSDALNFTFKYVPEKTIVIIISDFIGIERDSKWQDLIKNNSTRFEIIPIMVRDPVDSELPKSKSSVILKDPFSDRKIKIQGNKIREKYKHFVKMQEENLRKFFSKVGISLLRLDANKPFVQPVIKYFNQRRRKRK